MGNLSFIWSVGPRRAIWIVVNSQYWEINDEVGGNTN